MRSPSKPPAADRLRLDTLRALPPAPDIDFVFIDAGKPGYADYWRELVPRVRLGGLLLADSTLWSGAIVQADPLDADTSALRACQHGP